VCRVLVESKKGGGKIQKMIRKMIRQKITKYYNTNHENRIMIKNVKHRKIKHRNQNIKIVK
jgi:hypothetical protein